MIESVHSIPINELLSERHSGRAYDSGRMVERDDLVSLLEAARWAPSCFGDEPWRYLVFDKQTNPTGWQRAFECLAEGNQGWAKDAPVLLVSLACDNFGYNGKPNRWAQHDVGAASENLCLQAVDRGLMAHQMGGFDPRRVIEEFGVPAGHTPMAMITVGYALPMARLEGEVRERESVPRTRKPLIENFFEGGWGTPLAGD